MSNVIAIVKSMIGQAEVISPEGVRRQLIEGDRLFKGDQLVTGPPRPATWRVPRVGAPQSRRTHSGAIPLQPKTRNSLRLTKSRALLRP